ncbi:MAG: winged helix-turn-helix domain-containing protein [Candidatus Methanospirare jalkutatii]|nr:winged helix-turn-helix domain-containing protein [Candidatus Methanospirare jalkutatii]
MRKKYSGLRQYYDPDAFLRRRRNVRRGLSARTKILAVLRGENARAGKAEVTNGRAGKAGDSNGMTASEISRVLGLSYSATMHHLHLLEAEGILTHEIVKGHYKWKITGRGQKRLV